MELLALENLTRYYGSHLALEAAQVTLPAGALGLLGPNGAGKSTLLKVLLGLLPPSSGRARLLGLDVRDRSLEVRAHVGYLSESDAIVPGLSAVEFVALAGELSGMRRKDAHRRAHEVLAHLGIEESRYRRVEELSTGTRQRVRLAQALVHDPELLILDEPTNGLDPSGRRAMLDLIRALHGEHGKSIILSSHLLEDVESVCDSVVILDRGRILAHGRIDVLRLRLPNRYRARVSGDAAGYVHRLREAGVLVEGGPVVGPDGADLDLELPEGLSPRAILASVGDGRDVGEGREIRDGSEAGLGQDVAVATVLRSLVPREESLQDIFRRIVGSGEAAGAV